MNSTKEAFECDNDRHIWRFYCLISCLSFLQCMHFDLWGANTQHCLQPLVQRLYIIRSLGRVLACKHQPCVLNAHQQPCISVLSARLQWVPCETCCLDVTSMLYVQLTISFRNPWCWEAPALLRLHPLHCLFRSMMTETQMCPLMSSQPGLPRRKWQSFLRMYHSQHSKQVEICAHAHTNCACLTI